MTAVQELAPTIAPRLKLQEPVLVFLKAGDDPLAFTYPLIHEVGEHFQADIHSLRSIQHELQIRKAQGDYDSQESEAPEFSATATELFGLKMVDSIRNGRNVVLDTLLLSANSRRPFIGAANILGAEVVALNILSNKTLRRERADALEPVQRTKLETIRTADPYEKPTGQEGIHHVLYVPDNRISYQVLGEIVTELAHSRKSLNGEN